MRARRRETPARPSPYAVSASATNAGAKTPSRKIGPPPPTNPASPCAAADRSHAVQVKAKVSKKNHGRGVRAVGSIGIMFRFARARILTPRVAIAGERELLGATGLFTDEGGRILAWSAHQVTVVPVVVRHWRAARHRGGVGVAVSPFPRPLFLVLEPIVLRACCPRFASHSQDPRQVPPSHGSDAVAKLPALPVAHRQASARSKS